MTVVADCFLFAPVYSEGDSYKSDLVARNGDTEMRVLGLGAPRFLKQCELGSDWNIRLPLVDAVSAASKYLRDVGMIGLTPVTNFAINSSTFPLV